MKKCILAITLLLFCMVSFSHAAARAVHRKTSDAPTPVRQWENDGIILNNTAAGSSQKYPVTLCNTAEGNVIVAWLDSTYTGNNYDMDVMVQKFNLSGNPIWPNPVRMTNGYAYADGSNYHPFMVSDGAGGAIVAWQDDYNGPSAQRIDNNGNLIWSNSAQISTSANLNNMFSMVSDGAGGAYFCWEDYRNYYSNGYKTEIYAQHMDGSGVIWASDLQVASASDNCYHYPYQMVLNPSNGGAILVSLNQGYSSGYTYLIYAYWLNSNGTLAGSDKTCDYLNYTSRSYPAIISNASGECVICWQDDRSYSYIYAQKYSAGMTPLWTANGVKVPQTSSQFYSENPVIADDGAGGAFIAWIDSRIGPNTLFAQRLAANGSALWQSDSQLSSNNAYDYVSAVNMISDGLGGALVNWLDEVYLNGNYYDTNYVQKVGGDGTVGGADWPAAGVPIDPGAKDNTGYAYVNHICSDGSNGAILAWNDFRSDASGDIYGQRITSNGDLAWTPNGTVLAAPTTESTSLWAASVPDGYGGAVTTWFDNRLGYNSIFAQRFDASGNRLWGPGGVSLDPDSADSPAVTPSICRTSDNFLIVWSRAGGRVVNNTQSVTGNAASQAKANAAKLSTRSSTSLRSKSAGRINSGGNTEPGIWAQKLDINGNPLWTVSSGGGENVNGKVAQVKRFVKDVDNIAHPVPVVVYYGADIEFPTVTSDDSGGGVVAFVAEGSGGTGGPSGAQSITLSSAPSIQTMANNVNPALKGKTSQPNILKYFYRPKLSNSSKIGLNSIKLSSSMSAIKARFAARAGKNRSVKSSRIAQSGNDYIYAKKILADGQLDTNWGSANYYTDSQGIQVSFGGYDAFPSICKLDDGTRMIAWDYENENGDNWTSNIMGQKISLSNGSLAWQNEQPIQAVDNDWSVLPSIIQTGPQEIMAVWADYTSDASNYMIYGQKVSCSTEAVPLWGPGGKQISVTEHIGTNPEGGTSPYDNYFPRATLLPSGNACVAWQTTYAWDYGPYDHDWPVYPMTGHIYTQVVDPNGSPTLSDDFAVAQESANPGKEFPFLANTSNPNEVYVTWDYNNVGIGNSNPPESVKHKCIYGQKITFPSAPPVPVTPEAPVNLSGLALSTSSIRWSWNSGNIPQARAKLIGGTDGYHLFNLSGTVIATTAASVLSYDEPGLQPDTSYSRYVTAFNSFGDSSPSNIASAKTNSASINAPTNMGGVALSPSSIRWSWTSDGVNITNFLVISDSGTIVATLSASARSYDESDLSVNSLYKRYVKAYNSSLDIGSSSSLASVYTLAGVPTGVTATAATSTSLSLSWSGNGTRYSIERAASASGPWNYLAGSSFSSGLSSASYPDSGLSPSTAYWYRVSAFNGDGIKSDPSAAASFTTLSNAAPVVSPTVTTVTPGTRILATTNTQGAFSLIGTNFEPGATVILRKAGQSDITGANVTISADRTLANFSASLPGKSNVLAVGYWDIIVTNPDGGTATLSRGFLFEYPEGQVFFYPSRFSTTGVRAMDTSTQPRIAYTLSDNKPVDLFIYDVRDMKVVYHRKFQSGQTGGKFGYNEIFWDGKTDFGNTISNGSYVLQAYTQGTLIGQTYFTVKN